MWCCTDDEGLALRSRPAGGGFKPPHAALAEDRRGERWGKGIVKVSGGDREGECKRIAADVSKLRDDIETGVSMRLRDEPGGCPPIGQVVSGMQATRARSAASVRNRRRRIRIHPAWSGRREGVSQAARSRKGLSTVAGCAGGPARSSDEAPVTGAERRGRVVRDCVYSINQGFLGGVAWTS
jgi:hypothetical protein